MDNGNEILPLGSIWNSGLKAMRRDGERRQISLVVILWNVVVISIDDNISPTQIVTEYII